MESGVEKAEEEGSGTWGVDEDALDVDAVVVDALEDALEGVNVDAEQYGAPTTLR